jgi:hypothetical protein
MSGLTPMEKWKLMKQGIDPDAPPRPSTGSMEDRYKKPGEPCQHPPDMRTRDEGPTIGAVTLCLACGRIINDPDMRD